MSPGFWVIFIAFFVIAIAEGRLASPKGRNGRFVLRVGWFVRGISALAALLFVWICVVVWTSGGDAFIAKAASTMFAVGSCVGCLMFHRLRVAYSSEEVVITRLGGLGRVVRIPWNAIERIEDDLADVVIIERSGKRWKIQTLMRGHRDLVAFSRTMLGPGNANKARAGEK